MATFPTTLPKPSSRAGMSVEHRPMSRRTTMEIGATRHRQISSNPISEVNLGWSLNQSQMAQFITFLEEDINFGVDYFEIELDLGKGLTQYSNVRFTEYPTWDWLSYGIWIVAAKVEVEPNV